MRPKQERESKPSDNAGAFRWARAASLGIEFAASAAGLALVGYWVGGFWNAQRHGMLVGAIIGCAAGFYNFFRQAQALLKEGARWAQRRGRDPDRGDDDNR